MTRLALDLLGIFLFVMAVLWTLTAIYDLAERGVARSNRKGRRP